MNGLDLSALVGKDIQFTYDNEDRHANVEQVKECKNGKTMLVCKDYNRNDQYRSFDVTKIQLLSIG